MKYIFLTLCVVLIHSLISIAGMRSTFFAVSNVCRAEFYRNFFADKTGRDANAKWKQFNLSEK